MKPLSRAVFPALLLMALCLAMVGQAAVAVKSAPRGPMPGPIKTVLPAGPTRVPMDHRSGNPIVKVLVNNEGPFHFLIDTGATGHARIDRSLVERFGLRVTGTALAGDGTGRNNRESDVVRIDSLTLGEANFSGVEALSGDYRQADDRSGPPVVGILCFGLFAECVLTIDYPRNAVIVKRDGLRAGGKHIVPFTMKQEIPAVEMILAGRRFEAGVDTGSRGGLMMPLRARDGLALASEPVAAGTAETRFNKVAITRAPVDGDLSLAGHDIARPDVYFADLFDQANLGYEVLRNFSLTFDQKNERIRFQSTESRDSEAQPAPGVESSAMRAAAPAAPPPGQTDLPWIPVYQAMDMTDGKPVIEAGVNGKGPFRFYLDTATPYTLLDRRFAEEVGALSRDEDDAEDRSSSRAARPSTVTVETLSIGSAVFSGVRARLGDLGDGDDSADRPVGALGFRLFSECLLTLDYPEKRVIVERGQLLFPDGKEVLDLIIKDDAPFALITLGSIDLETCLDSGSTKGLVVPGGLAEESTDPIAATAVIGGHTISDPEVIVSDSAPHAVAGSEFLRSFSLTFDQKNRRLRIAQPY